MVDGHNCFAHIEITFVSVNVAEECDLYRPTLNKLPNYCTFHCTQARMQGGITGVVTPLNLSEVKSSGSTFGSCTTVTAQFSSFVHQIVATRCQILRLKCTKFDFG